MRIYEGIEKSMNYVRCGWVNTVFNIADHNVGCIRSGTFKLYLVIMTRVFMAEQMFMFATTAGFMIGLGVLLFIVRGRRSKGVKAKSYDSDGN